MLLRTMFNNIYEKFDTTPAPTTRNLKYDTLTEILTDFENFCKTFCKKRCTLSPTHPTSTSAAMNVRKNAGNTVPNANNA